MFRPPFLARVAAGAAVYALEETRRLPRAAMNLPVTAVSQLLQTTMHVQQFVTSLALKGDTVFERLSNGPVEQPQWARFDEDIDPEQTPSATAHAPARTSRFGLYTTDGADPGAQTNGHVIPVRSVTALKAEPGPDITSGAAPEVVVPEVAARYDYANINLAQLRARLRMLTVADLTALLEYEQKTRARAPFVTMLTNRIATVQAQ